MAMTHGRAQGLPGAALLGFAWTLAVALAVVLPDVRPLTSLARTPIVVIGMPFGWPPGIGLSTLFPWPVINQLLLILGGLLWAATAIAYQRRSRNACGHCGRTDTPTGWITPTSAARWGRWVTAIAVTVPILYALTRWAWALGIPLGVTRELLREQASDTPDIWLAGAALATLAVGGVTLTLGLVQRWGEVYPLWIPVLGGKVVRPRTAVDAFLRRAGGRLSYRSPKVRPRCGAQKIFPDPPASPAGPQEHRASLIRRRRGSPQ